MVTVSCKRLRVKLWRNSYAVGFTVFAKLTAINH